MFTRNNPLRYIDPTGLADYEIDDQGTKWAIVEKGDNLTNISRDVENFPHNPSVNDIASLNGLDDPDLIMPGQRLKMPGKFNTGKRTFYDKMLHASQRGGEFNTGVLKGAVSLVSGVNNLIRAGERTIGTYGDEHQRKANIEGKAIDNFVYQYFANDAFRGEVNNQASNAWNNTNITDERAGMMTGRAFFGILLSPVGFSASVGDISNTVEKGNGVVDMEKVTNSILFGTGNQ